MSQWESLPERGSLVPFLVALCLKLGASLLLFKETWLWKRLKRK